MASATELIIVRSRSCMPESNWVRPRSMSSYIGTIPNREDHSKEGVTDTAPILMDFVNGVSREDELGDAFALSFKRFALHGSR